MTTDQTAASIHAVPPDFVSEAGCLAVGSQAAAKG